MNIFISTHGQEGDSILIDESAVWGDVLDAISIANGVKQTEFTVSSCGRVVQVEEDEPIRNVEGIYEDAVLEVNPVDRIVSVQALTRLDIAIRQTSLKEAVAARDLRLCDLLLATDTLDVSVVMVSMLQHGCFDDVVFMLKEGIFKGGIDDQTVTDISLLLHASKHGAEEVCSVLLSHGADPEQLNAGISALHLAAEGGHYGVAKLILSKVKQSIERKDRISEAIQQKQYTAFVNAIHPIEGYHALSLLIETKREDEMALRFVQFLIEEGAELGESSRKGKTVLYSAAEMGLAEVCSVLIAQGADPEEKSRCETPLLGAVKGRDAEAAVGVMERLLAVAPGCVDVRSMSGYTALMIASRRNNLAAVKLLLVHGADVNHVSRTQSALHYTVHESGEVVHHDVAYELILNGADISSFSTAARLRLYSAFPIAFLRRITM